MTEFITTFRSYIHYYHMYYSYRSKKAVATSQTSISFSNHF